MSDIELRFLERRYNTFPTDENLYQLNVYRVRQGLVDLPATFEEVRNIERLGRGALPILVAALAQYYVVVTRHPPSIHDRPVDDEDRRDREIRNAVYHIIGVIGRWGSINDIPLLEEVENYIEDNHEGYHGNVTSRKARDVVTWLKIRHDYAFTDETTVWDLVNASPLIDKIIVIPNTHHLQRTWGALGSSRWRQEGTAYVSSVYREGSGWGISQWRVSVPGYGTAESTADAALVSATRKILSAKYRGWISLRREPLPREEWPTEIVLVITQEAVDILSEQQLHWRMVGGLPINTDPHRWNFLFDYPDER